MISIIAEQSQWLTNIKRKVTKGTYGKPTSVIPGAKRNITGKIPKATKTKFKSIGGY